MLEPFTPAARYELPFGEGGGRMAFHLDFKVPRTVGLPRVSFKGKLTAHMAAGNERITFTSLAGAGGVSRRRGGVTVTLLRGNP